MPALPSPRLVTPAVPVPLVYLSSSDGTPLNLGPAVAVPAEKSIPASAGTFPTTGGLFVGLVIGVILIIGGLTFFPALALGPIVEHLAMNANTLF